MGQRYVCDVGTAIPACPVSTTGQAQVQGPRQIDGTDVGRDQKFAVSDQYKAPFAFIGK